MLWFQLQKLTLSFNLHSRKTKTKQDIAVASFKRVLRNQSMLLQEKFDFLGGLKAPSVKEPKQQGLERYLLRENPSFEAG